MDALPAYNLSHSQMVKMAASLKRDTTSQLSFHMASAFLIHGYAACRMCQRAISQGGERTLSHKRGCLFCPSEESDIGRAV